MQKIGPNGDVVVASLARWFGHIYPGSERRKSTIRDVVSVYVVTDFQNGETVCKVYMLVFVLFAHHYSKAMLT